MKNIVIVLFALKPLNMIAFNSLLIIWTDLISVQLNATWS